MRDAAEVAEHATTTTEPPRRRFGLNRTNYRQLRRRWRPGDQGPGKHPHGKTTSRRSRSVERAKTRRAA